MIKLIIFDFDGTLVDSKEAIFGVIRDVLKKAGHEIGVEFKKNMGKYPLHEHLRRVGVDGKLGELVESIKNGFLTKSSSIKLAKNAKSLKKIKCDKIILTNNSYDFVHAMLIEFKLDFIEEVHWPKKPLAKSEHIKRIMKRRKLKPEEVLCVGDRDSDIVAARKAGCYSVAVGNGISWSSISDLMKSKPDFIIENLGELNQIVNGLNSS